MRARSARLATVFVALAIALWLLVFYGLSPGTLRQVMGRVASIVTILALGVLVIVIRIWPVVTRGDRERSEFRRWLDSGARLSHPTLVSAFRHKVKRIGSADVSQAGLAVCGYEDDIVEPREVRVPPGRWQVELVDSAARVSWASAEVVSLHPAWTKQEREWAEEIEDMLVIASKSHRVCLGSVEAVRRWRLHPRQFQVTPTAAPKVSELRTSNGGNVFVFEVGQEGVAVLVAKAHNGSDIALFLDWGVKPRAERVYGAGSSAT